MHLSSVPWYHRLMPHPPRPSAKSFVPRPFRPAWWLPGAHGQTVAGRYLRERTGVHYRRERMETEDGDFVDLDWATVEGMALPSTAPLVLLVHGLEGSANSSYMLESCRALAERGVRAVAMNFRSCSGEPNRLPRFYHAGDTADLAAVLRHLRAAGPAATLGALGFSLGANVLLKYLGERGEGSAVRAAAATPRRSSSRCAASSGTGRSRSAAAATHRARSLRDRSGTLTTP